MQKTSLQEHIIPVVAALKTYWFAILVIQGCALAVVLCYFYMEGASTFFGSVADWKNRGGLLFVAVSTVISGGLVPEILKRFFRPTDARPPSLGELSHQFVMWGILGVLVDRFYKLQSYLFGDANNASTLIPKVLLDQLAFTPLMGLPFIVLWFMLYENRYSLRAWMRALSFHEITRRVLPLWLTCLGFWPVMLLIVYSLPSDLQFPLFLFGNAAYSMLMIFIARRQAAAGQNTSVP